MSGNVRHVSAGGGHGPVLPAPQSQKSTPRNMVSIPTEKSARSRRLPGIFYQLLDRVHVPGTERRLLTNEFTLIPRRFLRHGFLPREGKADMLARSIAQEWW